MRKAVDRTRMMSKFQKLSDGKSSVSNIGETTSKERNSCRVIPKDLRAISNSTSHGSISSSSTSNEPPEIGIMRLAST